jgi:hypothetical protein
VRKISFLVSCLLLAFLVLTPASSRAAIYSWRDANGVLIYSNSPSESPGTSQVVIRTARTVDATLPEPSGMELADGGQPQIPERSHYMATQAEFAVQLVEELGLGQPADAGQAADVLTDLRIAPPLGEWVFNQPMTPELTLRLRQLTVAAAGRGAISITPEQALLAFDTAAALLNVDIPASSNQYTVSDAPYPIADMPPLIEIYSPPPLFFPYYIWTPIAGGFWWGNAFFPGYYVLNVGLFCNHYYDHYYGDHSRYAYNRHDGGSKTRFRSIDPAHISHHMKGHVENHQLRARPAVGAGRTVSSPWQPRSPFVAMHSGRVGVRTSRPVAAPARASFTPPMRVSRTSLSSPTYRSPAYRAPSYRPPSYHSPSSRSSYTASRSMGRGAYPPASIHRGGTGFALDRRASRGGMDATRPAGNSLNGRRMSAGGHLQHSTGGGFSHAEPSLHR